MTAEGLLNRIEAVLGGTVERDETLARQLLDASDIGLLYEAGRLLDGIAADRLVPAGTRPLRIAVVRTFTCDDLVPLLRVAMLASSIDPTIHLCPFGQFIPELTDPDSELARFRPDVTFCLLDTGAVLPQDWDPRDPAALGREVRNRLGMFTDAATAFADRTGSHVVTHTIALPAADRRTVIGYRGAASLAKAWRQMNIDLLELGEEHDGVFTIDLESMIADLDGPIRDERRYRFGAMAWTPAVEWCFAREAAAFGRAAAGLARKVLVLDLDNTLWGGVLGDDGPQGIQLGTLYPGNCYTDLQRRALALKNQGVLLAVVSKNEEAIVDSVLREHPDMVLRGEDFVAVVANWEHKSDNITALADELSLTLSSFVFADDNEYECDMVRTTLPDVRVVGLRGDPADHSSELLSSSLFNQLSTADDDSSRTRLYHGRRARQRFGEAHATVRDYLQELQIQVDVRETDEFSLPRLVQLALRTNQFNMVGRAHGESVTRQMTRSPDHVVLAVRVTDRFGSEGLVGGIWIACADDRWVLENMVLSCRVLARGIELALLQEIVRRAADAGVPFIEGRFRATERNKPASHLYPQAGFREIGRTDDVVRHELRIDEAPSYTPSWILVTSEEVRSVH